MGVLIKRRINDQKLKEIAEFASFLNPKQTILSTKLQMRIQKHGMKVYTWTVNNKKQMRMFKKMQLDGIISDFCLIISWIETLNVFAYYFFFKNVPVDFRNPPLSTSSGILASQLFGRGVANSFKPVRVSFQVFFYNHGSG